MSSKTTNPVGTVRVPALLCALTGTVLAVSMERMGFLNEATSLLTQFWEREPFFLVDPEVISSEWNWLVAFIVSWGVAYFTLASDQLWRRLLIGLMAGIILAGFMPSLALWGILWLPVVTGIAVLWSWACAMLYSGQHAMPCEVGVTAKEAVSMRVEMVPRPMKKKDK
ncbi:MAG: hypothetical protein ABGY95_10800 [Rubritalea sp.]|uniref:hypothetical protein n=1 Tax=Rubritalea sp. TaxID=2109375 RepID=UPI00324213B5